MFGKKNCLFTERIGKYLHNHKINKIKNLHLLNGRRKLFSFIVMISFLFSLTISSSSLASSSLSNSFDTLKNRYSEHVQTLKDNGATESEMRAFLEALDRELQGKDLTADNFNNCLLNAAIKVFLQSEHANLANAILTGYPDAINELRNGNVPEAFIPIRDVLYEILVSDSSGGSPGAGSSAGGGVPSVTNPNLEEITHELGRAILDTENATLTLDIDTNKMNELINNASAQLLLTLPESEANQQEVSLPGEALQNARAKGTKLILQYGEVEIVLPANSISLQRDELDKEVKVSVRKLDSTTETEGLNESQTVRKGLTPVGAVYEFSVRIQDENDTQTAGDNSENKSENSSRYVTSFTFPVTVKMNLPDNLEGVNLQKLGVYRYNKENKSWEYMGGRLSKDRKSIEVDLNGFSRYAVMEYDKNFTDLPSSHWACQDIEIMAARHIVEGMNDTQFEPNTLVTRAQFAALVQRSLGLKVSQANTSVSTKVNISNGTSANTSTNTTINTNVNTSADASTTTSINTSTDVFKDVKADAWYWEPVMAAVEAGIIQGYEDNTFRPNQQITREEMAVLVIRGIRYANLAGSLNEQEAEWLLASFNDQRQISSWAKNAVAQAVQLGIINGRSIGEFAPHESASRAEAAVILKRLLDQVVWLSHSEYR